MNILESSGIFATYKLTINYRSNQMILTFANKVLDDIEANQFAKINLYSNQLKQCTEDEFLKNVQYYYHQFQRITDFNEALPSLIALHVKPFLDECLKKDQQICFLGYTRREIYKVHECLKHLYPDKNIVNIVAERSKNTVIFSTFIMKYWRDMKFQQISNFCSTIANEIMTKLPYLVNNHQSMIPVTTRVLAKWTAENKDLIHSWYNQVTAGIITKDTFLNLVKENMLQFEIRNNAIRARLTSNKNQAAKESSLVKEADFLLSTIHGAKGLEFDNTVVLYKHEAPMPEEKKRLYYVAMTRAMQSEFVLAYGTATNTDITEKYKLALLEFHKHAPSPNSPFYTNSPDNAFDIDL